MSIGRNFRVSHQLFLKAGNGGQSGSHEWYFEVQGTEGRSLYHQGHKATLGNGLNSCKRLVLRETFDSFTSTDEKKDQFCSPERYFMWKEQKIYKTPPENTPDSQEAPSIYVSLGNEMFNTTIRRDFKLSPSYERKSNTHTTLKTFSGKTQPMESPYAPTQGVS